MHRKHQVTAGQHPPHSEHLSPPFNVNPLMMLQVIYRMACDTGSISGVPQQTMTVHTSLVRHCLCLLLCVLLVLGRV
jgi:hypothetical protein